MTTTSRPLRRFITFEGGEGAGKSTQVKYLVSYLQGLGFEVVATREPGGSPLAEELRRLLLAGLIAPFGTKAEALMFAAARIDHIDQVIKPALERGAFVICDRFADSTRVYQGAVGKVDDAFLSALEEVSIGAIRPALTFIIDVPAEIGLARAAARRTEQKTHVQTDVQTSDVQIDRFEGENIVFHNALRAAFQALSQRETERCVLLDGTLPPQHISDMIVQNNLLRHLIASASP